MYRKYAGPNERLFSFAGYILNKTRSSHNALQISDLGLLRVYSLNSLDL